jgi:hypothetical protein
MRDFGSGDKTFTVCPNGFQGFVHFLVLSAELCDLEIERKLIKVEVNYGFTSENAKNYQHPQNLK